MNLTPPTSTETVEAPEESAADSPLRVFTPQRPQWVRIGVLVFIAGYLGALVAVITIAHGIGDVKIWAEWSHKLMLVVMLIGMLITLAAYRKFADTE